MTFSPQASPINARIRTGFSGPRGTHLSPTLSPTHPELPKSWGKVWEAAGQLQVKPRTHFLPYLPLVTGSQAAALHSAPAGSPHQVLSTSSWSAGLCLVPRPDHPPAMPPVGDAASPRPSHPADLRPCSVLPSTCEPQMEQPLCHLHIEIESHLANGATLPLQVKTGGRRVPRPLEESTSPSKEGPWPRSLSEHIRRKVASDSAVK